MDILYSPIYKWLRLHVAYIASMGKDAVILICDKQLTEFSDVKEYTVGL